MLVLSRTPGETIHLPELGVTITIIGSRGNRTKVGIRAPETIRILRGELDDRTDRRTTDLVAERPDERFAPRPLPR
ncbi:MAG TPA: hypothetical protein DCQ98_20540 [Planctomycetaceae bacterium]|nr:hypothetical protein [Planctomycetaceae bacterium]HRE98978.1 carbon storage regulator [Pirellulaceae bacterium]